MNAHRTGRDRTGPDELTPNALPYRTQSACPALCSSTGFGGGVVPNHGGLQQASAGLDDEANIGRRA